MRKAPDPKCARCSQPVRAAELVTFSHGDLLHQRCGLILASERQIAVSRKLLKGSQRLIEKSMERIRKLRPQRRAR